MENVTTNRNFAVLVSDYPSLTKPNVFGFVHSRVRAYKQIGIDVDVYKISSKQHEYIFDNVTVFCGNPDYIRQRFDQLKYDVILIHFLDETKIRIIGNHKAIIWVHGFEALSWKRRLYNINPRLPLYIYENTKQLSNFKKYAIEHPNSAFVFVSNWMYNVTCTDIKHKITNYKIIHNYIDSSIFRYNKKTPNDVKKLLLIRSFANKKYANDITIRFLKSLSKKDYFKDLKISIYGTGKFFNKLTKKVNMYENVDIHNHFITQHEIAELQHHYGVFLCPTRQDAQGVSMCEAMSSGLVPLTSYNTAIPEFVNPETEGLLCENRRIDSFINAYETILFDAEKFQNMSEATSRRVQSQCSFENTILKEISLMSTI